MDDNGHDGSADGGRAGAGGPHPGFLHPHPKGWTGPHPHMSEPNRSPDALRGRLASLKAAQDVAAQRLDEELERLRRRVETVTRAREAVRTALGSRCAAEFVAYHPEPDPEMTALQVEEAEAVYRRAVLLVRRAELPAPAPVSAAVLYLREVAKSYRKGPWPAEVHAALERVADGLEQRENDRGAP